MIIAQSAATSRVYAVRHHERVDEDADILGLAAANAASAVSGTFVVNGSPTQTAMADSAGARSQVAQLVFAGIVLMVLLFLTGPLQYLPRSVLASIVFTIAVGMVDVKGLRAILHESPGEFYLAVFTAAAVVAIGEDDLAHARRLIEKHGYWRRKEELEDAEVAALGVPDGVGWPHIYQQIRRMPTTRFGRLATPLDDVPYEDYWI
jgi:hypothetical protein